MSRTKRIIAAFLGILLLSDVLLPTMALALSSGPSQPEVQGFTPAGVNDMVNLFTGDFSYNIPLLDVEGYPVNLAYSAGVGMDQEASWVGLGWNLNPGVVERNLRGLPDDFDGDKITRTMNLRPNRTFGLSYGVGFQLFGNEALGGTAGVSPSFNNYTGPAFTSSMGFSMRSTLGNGSTMSCGLGLSSSSNQGLTVSPKIGFDREVGNAENRNKAGLNFGLSINSMQGLTNVSFGATLSSAQQHVVTDNAGKKTRVKSARDKGEIAGTSSAFDLGSPTYSPKVALPMRNTSVSFNFTWPAEVQANHFNMTLGGFYSEQRLLESQLEKSAYGFLHLDHGQDDKSATLDFNREKDGPYSAERAGLGIASLTNDVFSVSGQGVSGSYRPFRSEVGHVFDAANSSSGSGGDVGLEVGVGFGVHGGANMMVNHSSTSSGDWSGGNQAGQRLQYRSLSNEPFLEPVFFREANEPTVEQDPTLWNVLGQDRALRFTLPKSGAFDYNLGAALTDGGNSIWSIPAVNYRQKREPRAQVMSFLDHRHALDLGLNAPPAHPGNPGWEVPKHHMSEITISGKSGERYIYGEPVYNFSQEDVEFAVEPTNSNADGYISYSNIENSVDNPSGRDHFYSRSVTPAYAYAFLLSAALSPDFSDVDGIRGPSAGDLGNYTKFTYTAADQFQWRTPAVPNRARWNKGLLGDDFDDKASYVHGTKEVRYLKTIETRNFIAIFELNDSYADVPGTRYDALGVNEDGTMDGTSRSSYLSSITLYKKQVGLDPDNYALNNIVPIKKVHFQYDYSLCPSTPNSAASGSHGKLTLKKIWFTYGRSDLGVTAPYLFDYANNVSYDSNAQDRWGNYKPNNIALPNDIFPYAEQNVMSANSNAAAWALNSIILPSGGKISVQYEADDYATVQNKPAMEMVKVFGIVPDGSSSISPMVNFMPAAPLLYQNKLILELPSEWQNISSQAIENEIHNLNDLYFRMKIKLGSWGLNKDDFVSGYAKISPSGVHVDDPGINRMATIILEPIPVDGDIDNSSFVVNPIYRAGLEFLRLNYPDRVHANSPEYDGSNITEEFLISMVTSINGFIGGIGAFFQGPNAAMAETPSFCSNIQASQSWVRLNSMSHSKKGGGHRVKTVKIDDAWNTMEDNEVDKNFTYGQSYTYGDENGSFGVAAYEPMSGADENPWRQPVYGENPTRALTPDERSYQETPFGESLFPGPVVGYSKVIVTDLYPSAADPAVVGTGTVVHEFYTANDFPTRVSMTDANPKRGNNEVNLLSLLGFSKIDHMHVSQGYVVETNDMHGKPKQISVYPQGSDQAISTTSYEYETDGIGSKHLKNMATVISPDGTIGQAEIGRQYEFVADTREFINHSVSGGAELNLDVIVAVVALLPIPMVWPKVSFQSTNFKSGVFVKKIHRFGLLKSVTQVNNGSRVTTENVAYDAQTGSVLVTKLTNAHEDPIYATTFPAYWHYDRMGPAYKNIGVHLVINLDQEGKAVVPNAQELFNPGDELSLNEATPSPAFGRYWVDEVGPNFIKVINADGGLPDAGVRSAVVIRSGRRNMQDVEMMSLTLQSDPLLGMGSNFYTKVLNASAQEYKDTWRSECNCIDGRLMTDNRWRLNRIGMWRLWKEEAWLTDRTRTIYDRNTDIRRDGVYTSFAPFYQVLNNKWHIELPGWTTAREVTEYSGRGQELENMDALGLYSAATFGYGGGLATSVAKNARHAEILTENFEDMQMEDCASRTWAFDAGSGTIEEGIAHTGRFGLRVTNGETASLTADIVSCPNMDCDLRIVSGWHLNGQGGLFSYTALYGTSPYNFSLELIGETGNSSAHLVTHGENTAELIWDDGSTMSSVIISVIDGTGCTSSLIWSDQ